jgi:Ser/Thr protein kinase RdoA (MazF antagonist)
MNKFTPEQASQTASEHYNLNNEASKLDGYVDENFLLETVSDEKFLLKISSEKESEQLNFQIEILKHLSNKNLPFQTSEIIANKDRNNLSKISGGKSARLLTRSSLGKRKPKNRKFTKQLG